MTPDQACVILGLNINNLPVVAHEMCTDELPYPKWVYEDVDWPPGQSDYVKVPVNKIKGSSTKGIWQCSWFDFLLRNPRADKNLNCYTQNPAFYWNDECWSERQRIHLIHYLTGDFYFVDGGGHHRVTIAKLIGLPEIYATVSQMRANEKLSTLYDRTIQAGLAIQQDKFSPQDQIILRGNSQVSFYLSRSNPDFESEWDEFITICESINGNWQERVKYWIKKNSLKPGDSRVKCFVIDHYDDILALRGLK